MLHFACVLLKYTRKKADKNQYKYDRLLVQVLIVMRSPIQGLNILANSFNIPVHEEDSGQHQ